MSTSPPGPTARLAMKRARNVLELKEEAGPEEARASFLRKLAAEHFVPPEEWIPAVNTLTGSALPITPEAAEAEAAWLGEQVEAFAAIYWLLPPERRLSKWVELSDLCREPFVRNRLLALERGLDVPVIPFADFRVDELAKLLRELFVLTPRNRAIKRAAWLAEHDEPEEHGTWREACRRLREESSATAGLEPEMLRSLEARSQALIGTSRNVPKSIDSRQALQDFQERLAKCRNDHEEVPFWSQTFGNSGQRLATAANAPKDTHESEFIWTVILGFMVIVALLRLASTDSSSSHEASDIWMNNPLRARPPAKLAPEWPKPPSREEQIKEYERYDPRSGASAPQGYYEWKGQKLLEELRQQPESLDLTRPTSR